MCPVLYTAMMRAASGTLDAVDEAAPMESFSTAAFATHEPYPLPSEHMFRCGRCPPLCQTILHACPAGANVSSQRFV